MPIHPPLRVTLVEYASRVSWRAEHARRVLYGFTRVRPVAHRHKSAITGTTCRRCETGTGAAGRLTESNDGVHLGPLLPLLMDFGPVHRDFERGRDADPDPVPFNRGDGDPDAVVDDDFFANLARKYEHASPLRENIWRVPVR